MTTAFAVASAAIRSRRAPAHRAAGRWIALGVLLVGACPLVPRCALRAGDSAAPAFDFAAVAHELSLAEKNNEIPIGVILPITGEFETYAQSALTGILSRIQEENAKGGIRGKKIRYVLCDSQNRPELYTEHMRALVPDQGPRVQAIIGPLFLDAALIVEQEAMSRRVVTISPTATRYWESTERPWSFFLGTPEQVQVRAISYALAEQNGVRQAAILSDLRHLSSPEMGRYFREAFQAFGGTILTETSISSAAEFLEDGTLVESIRAEYRQAYNVYEGADRFLGVAFYRADGHKLVPDKVFA